MSTEELTTKTMTVKMLRDALAGLPDDMPVILQRDAEGSGYSPLACADADNNSYASENGWSGDVSITTLTDEARSRGYTEEDVISGVPCVVLCPVN